MYYLVHALLEINEQHLFNANTIAGRVKKFAYKNTT